MSSRQAVSRTDEAAAFLDVLAANAPIGIALFDRDGRYVRVNEALAAIDRLPIAAHVGRTPRELLGDDAATIEGLVRRVLDTGQAVLNVDVTASIGIAPSERRRWVASGYPARTHDGAIVGVGVMVDVTTEGERAGPLRDDTVARTEAARQRLLDLFDRAPAIIAVTRGPNHVFELANAHFFQMVGHAGRRDVVGRPAREAFPELEGQGFFRIADEVYRTGKPFVANEMSAMIDPRGDGQLEEAFFNFAVQPLIEPDGTVDGLMVHAVVVTEQVSARRSLERLLAERAAERDRLRQILDVLPEGVTIVDAEGRLQLRNRAAAQLLGPSAAGSLAQVLAAGRVTRLDGSPCRPEDLPMARSLRGELVRGEQLLVRVDVDRVTPVLMSTAPLLDARGRVSGAVGVFQDISSLKDLERERIEFFEMASHEIKTPITTVRGQIQLAKRYAARGDTHERLLWSLDSANEQMSRLVRLINDLLDMSRIQSGRMELRLEPADLVSVLGQAIARNAPASERHPLRLRVPEGVVSVMADHHRIDQVLDNLLSNAVKCSPAGGAIDLSLTVRRRKAIVRIRDRGVGIPEPDRQQLFERFFRTSNTMQYGGTGLGLYISRQILERHGGRIWLDESSTAGSTFAFALPLQE